MPSQQQSIKNRSKIDILASILHAANGGAKRSEIIRENYSLIRYIIFLCDIDLLKFNSKDKIFKTTMRGMEFLRLYDQLVELL
ncbi:MAG TPA: winged helix-turn-helix domain-containing protein [Nitrososphaeraceae archaeon]|jgi:predicted transcriptional regulator